ncbi:ABC transporter ATP-binding protein [Nodosilinea sp. PGN35]|uniref:ABC transporter ATP-binding protein n=1 Tax=Nodosilinea sp. PGN35 TaxID=3020489 RepID=UPI0023B315A1|nr:ABC transporter ATP-binding protein [Nodosilinea sp. TSF1-S3]MDF0368163.1 ABC transporter ATP-binding protein [Nodosilinea sp. TSF1-S3]
MSDTVIRVENLGKKYTIGHQQQERYTALRDVLAKKTKGITQRLNPKSKIQNPKFEEFWALKNVSFEVRRGDRIGIIGRNGAGKSTLLKILSRITEPTEGRISIKGRVASLLEVGTGFHPELTGRENIYLNGAILGMSKVDIRRQFDEIVAFAEVEKFLDTPVKRYSSGMYVRLAFAVAAHLEPEILIVDEVLAVGDAAFQKKCLGKMEDVAEKEGRTVVFVSHNMATLKSLCNSALLLRQGSVIDQGSTEGIVDYYLRTSIQTHNPSPGEIHWPNSDTAPGCQDLRLASLRLLGKDGIPQQVFESSQSIDVEITYKIFNSLRGMRLILQILTSEGVVAFTSTDHNSRVNETIQAGLYTSICTIPANLLNAGMYLVKVGAGIPGVRVLLQGKEFLELTVESSNQHGSHFHERWPGVLAPKLQWQIFSVKEKAEVI